MICFGASLLQTASCLEFHSVPAVGLACQNFNIFSKSSMVSNYSNLLPKRGRAGHNPHTDPCHSVPLWWLASSFVFQSLSTMILWPLGAAGKTTPT